MIEMVNLTDTAARQAQSGSTCDIVDTEPTTDRQQANKTSYQKPESRKVVIDRSDAHQGGHANKKKSSYQSESESSNRATTSVYQRPGGGAPKPLCGGGMPPPLSRTAPPIDRRIDSAIRRRTITKRNKSAKFERQSQRQDDWQQRTKRYFAARAHLFAAMPGNAKPPGGAVERVIIDTLSTTKQRLSG
jgi:hypothetical protein